MFDLLISSAMAQDNAAGAAPNPIMNLIPMLLVFVIFYVFIILPNKKQKQQTQAFISQLEKGQEVFTNAGILGTISGITDKIVTLELEGGAKMKVLKSQIGGSTKQIFEKQPEKK